MLKSSNNKIEEILIRDLRCKHIDKEVSITGELIEASEVRPQAVLAKFECPKCETIISVSQDKEEFTEPYRCSCGKTDGLKLLSKSMVDTQRLIIGQGKKQYCKEYDCKLPSEVIAVFLKEDLCDSKHKIFDRIGKKINVIGKVCESPKTTKTGGVSVMSELSLDCEKFEFVR